jgi:hypothetical protein
LVLTGQTEDGRLITGIANRDYLAFQDKAQFPWCLCVTVFLAEDKDSLPLPDQLTRASEWEETLQATLGAATRIAYLGHMTWPTERDILFYLSSPHPAHQLLTVLAENEKGLDWEYRIVHDPAWCEPVECGYPEGTF